MADDDKPAQKKRGRKKGTPKTGGRKKGTRNRNSMSVLAALDKANIPIIEFLIADTQCLDPGERINEWHRILRFCYPRLKSIEYTPPLLGSSPPPSASAGPAPVPPTKSQRFSFIRGQVTPKSEAPDK